MEKTRIQLIKELESKRKVQLVSGKWVAASGFNWSNFKKKDLEQLYKGSKKR